MLKRTASAQDLLTAAEAHTANGPSIHARLVALLGGNGIITSADVAQALNGRTRPLGPEPFSFDVEKARKNA